MRSIHTVAFICLLIAASTLGVLAAQEKRIFNIDDGEFKGKYLLQTTVSGNLNALKHSIESDIEIIVVAEDAGKVVDGFLPYLPHGIHVVVHGSVDSESLAVIAQVLGDSSSSMTTTISKAQFAKVPIGFPLKLDLDSHSANLWSYLFIPRFDDAMFLLKAAGEGESLSASPVRSKVTLRSSNKKGGIVYELEYVSETEANAEVEVDAPVISGATKPLMVGMERNIGGNGYHRSVITHLYYNSDEDKDSNCADGSHEFVAAEVFPLHVYFDIYELQERERLSAGLRTQSWIDPDVEASTMSDSAVSSLLVVHFGADFSLPFEAPFHLRYQPAEHDAHARTHAPVKISPPLLYARCKHESKDREWSLVRAMSQSKSMEKMEREIEVPIGNVNDLNLVIAGTLIATIAGLLLVFWRIM